jgi:hypothetical protein
MPKSDLVATHLAAGCGAAGGAAAEQGHDAAGLLEPFVDVLIHRVSSLCTQALRCDVTFLGGGGVGGEVEKTEKKFGAKREREISPLLSKNPRTHGAPRHARASQLGRGARHRPPRVLGQRRQTQRHRGDVSADAGVQGVARGGNGAPGT